VPKEIQVILVPREPLLLQEPQEQVPLLVVLEVVDHPDNRDNRVLLELLEQQVQKVPADQVELEPLLADAAEQVVLEAVDHPDNRDNRVLLELLEPKEHRVLLVPLAQVPNLVAQQQLLLNPAALVNQDNLDQLVPKAHKALRVHQALRALPELVPLQAALEQLVISEILDSQDNPEMQPLLLQGQ
jgi:hypothetical protein